MHRCLLAVSCGDCHQLCGWEMRFGPEKGNVRIHTIEWIGGKIDIACLDKE